MVLFTPLVLCTAWFAWFAHATGRTHNGHTAAARLSLIPSPYTTGKKFPSSPRRKRHCFVDALGNGQDDAPQIIEAVKSCNNGGTVALLDPLYIIGSVMDLRGLEAIDFDIQGILQFTNDTEYWASHSFQYTFQGANTMIAIGGKDVNVFGSGKGGFDAQGQVWWDRFARNSSLNRPMFISWDGLDGATISGLNLYNPPNWFQWITDCKDVIFDGLNIIVKVSGANGPKNTDGYDTFRSDNIVVQNSVIVNTDDCVALKPNSTNMVFQNLTCTGSHGMTVGSLGQYENEIDIVENILFYNTHMINSTIGARIKVWSGVDPSVPNNGASGGGLGRVHNVTYDKMLIENVDASISLTQCYGAPSNAYCNQFPSNMTMVDITYKDISGKTSKKTDPRVGDLICSTPNRKGSYLDLHQSRQESPPWLELYSLELQQFM
ncbi:hypothetical protein H072_6550 [Dactylellina haptotyla CBS 200.50]|uniref:galacturonan 1,4-alpha-galacturonidase n=1 Tax=Dactylellina haptotyla (strain CBS 200.50) TaxID=1284197 RepID=S8BK01_DACHA|nr:hypothetical protein H072_6550 [Dactylellina haptotyla CBS 200.50]